MVTIILRADNSIPVSLLGEDVIAKAADALESWVNTDVAPHWSQGAYKIISMPRNNALPAFNDHIWPIELVAHAPAADKGAAGYHDRGNSGGPMGHIFVLDILEAGMDWVTVTSHEIVEMMVNRNIQSWAALDINSSATVYWMEACDPVEGYSYAHTHVGTQYTVTNFVLPAYFVHDHAGPFDRLGLVPSPFTPLKGGDQFSAQLVRFADKAPDKIQKIRRDPDDPNPAVFAVIQDQATSTSETVVPQADTETVTSENAGSPDSSFSSSVDQGFSSSANPANNEIPDQVVVPEESAVEGSLEGTNPASEDPPST